MNEIEQNAVLIDVPTDAVDIVVGSGLTRASSIRVELDPQNDAPASLATRKPTPERDTPALHSNLTTFSLSSYMREKATDGPHALAVRVVGLGDTPSVQRFFVLTQHEGDPQWFVFDPIGDPCRPGTQYRPQPLAPNTTPADIHITPLAYVRRMEQWFAHAPGDPVTRYRRHFFELDRDTHPDLTKSNYQRSCDVDYSRKVLLRHCVARLTRLRTRATLRSEALPSFLAGRIHRILQLYKKSIEASFTDFSEFEEAFEKFANAELRFELEPHYWTSQPSSGLFFLFGELALYGAEHSSLSDQPFWLNVARVLVRTQRIFCRVYGPPGGPGSNLSDYHACNLDLRRRFKCREMADLARTFECYKLPDVLNAAAEHAQEYLSAMGSIARP